LVLFYITLICLRELIGGKAAGIAFLAAAAVVWILLMIYGGGGFILLGVFLGLEVLSRFGARWPLYLLSYVAVLVPGPMDPLSRAMIITLLIALYLQHENVVLPLKKQTFDDTVAQQDLKKDARLQEYATRAALSQTLHDKLGHNINGSIYQLEASKVVMEKDPDKAKGMIQAVIDQLRTGMDEIRAILRKERPEKKKMAILQLHELCVNCNDRGVEAELTTQGDTSAISDELWEVILDNVFEAVTNAMKYSKCKRIDISLHVMNRMAKCQVSDDGVGCGKIEDGMGISGMRRRVRNAGGTIDFESEAGFTVNMLLPLYPE
ncbi:MAG: hypothetical protein K6E16_11120, partial [Lachnospiraceae bacterium]|nr:hypothetical protein [Lachnospiraceae bacterium]